jgi:hypothetical protein
MYTNRRTSTFAPIFNILHSDENGETDDCVGGVCGTLGIVTRTSGIPESFAFCNYVLHEGMKKLVLGGALLLQFVAGSDRKCSEALRISWEYFRRFSYGWRPCA